MEFANHASNSVGLVVIGEETQKMLMVHRILHEDIYNRQGALREQAWHRWVCCFLCQTLGQH
jgi:fido (protein-threonine AMPylation protein)